MSASKKIQFLVVIGADGAHVYKAIGTQRVADQAEFIEHLLFQACKLHVLPERRRPEFIFGFFHDGIGEMDQFAFLVKGLQGNAIAPDFLLHQDGIDAELIQGIRQVATIETFEYAYAAGG
jgi:hypothetical protein